MNEPWTGGLSSFGLLLILVFFLKKRGYFEHNDPRNINLGEIILSFLQFVTKLKYQQIILKANKGREQPEEKIRAFFSDNLMVPWVENPLMEQKNVTHSTYKFESILKLFYVSYESVFLGCFCNNHFNMQTVNIQNKQF